MAAAIIGGISLAFGVGSSILGNNERRSSESKQYALQKKQASLNNRYQTQQYKYDWQEAKRAYQYNLQSVALDRQNEAAKRQWSDQTSLLEWQHGMAIRDYEYGMQMRAYNKSEETFRQQLNFNNMAAQVAMESEDRWLDERFKETAFANQDIMVQMLQEEGKAGLLQNGRSAGKAVQSALAQAGRNQAILVESLVSAQKQSAVNRNKIQTDKYGADLMAEANRMLKPEIAPALPKPIPLPEAIFQDPMRPRKPPKPPKQLIPSAPTRSISPYLGMAADLAGGLAGLRNSADKSIWG